MNKNNFKLYSYIIDFDNYNRTYIVNSIPSINRDIRIHMLDEIYNLANKKIYIIDDYISLKTLVLLKNINKNVKVIIFSDNVNNGLHKIEFDDFIKEYNLNITFKKTNKIYHDKSLFKIIINSLLDNEELVLK